VPTSLLERPLTVHPAPRRRRPGLRLAGAVAAGALVLTGAGTLVGAARDLLPSWGNPVEQQVVDRTGPALITALTDLSEYRAARGTFSVVVDVEHDTKNVPSVISGERTTYVAQGSVDGIVDFGALGAGAVQAAPDRSTVTITLPRPTLGSTVLDPAQSRVVGRERGVLDRIGGAFSDSPTSEREVQAVAQRKLEDAARSSDVLSRSEVNTRSMLTALARSFGYQNVEVVFTGPGPV
ncbi:MAG TPA: DUF4230 domain-containing protein, partial [Mycobacteriales bacterium]|nr:DUF4230 domain-containing protein [Mycobacteriales bacterium]